MIAALFAIALLASLTLGGRAHGAHRSAVPQPGVRDRFMVTATLHTAPRRQPR